jgi:F0F1-type ATP synthase membrane subunit c/vacuolar-type H+-ATPase subunit K
MCGLAILALPGTVAMAAEPGQAADAVGMPSAYRSIGLGAAAALTMAVCVLGAGYAVARIGAAAMGAGAEKPE